MVTRPDICIFHFPCLDGLTAAWAVRKKYPDIEFLPSNYGDAADLTVFEGKHVLMVDFTYPREVVEAMLSVAASVTILDHHESAQETLQGLLDEGLVEGEFDMTRSGARMAWDAFFPADDFNEFDTGPSIGVVPHLVRYVEDRDLWKWKLSASRGVNAWIGSQEMTFDRWDFIAVELQDGVRFGEIAEIGTALVRQLDNFVDLSIKAAKRTMVIGGVEVSVVNAPHYLSSDIGNILSEGVPFAATYFDNGSGERVFSLRSKFGKQEGALNVAKIAKLYGGGGHAPASGFRVPEGWNGDDTTNVVPLRA